MAKSSIPGPSLVKPSIYPPIKISLFVKFGYLEANALAIKQPIE